MYIYAVASWREMHAEHTGEHDMIAKTEHNWHIYIFHNASFTQKRVQISVWDKIQSRLLQGSRKTKYFKMNDTYVRSLPITDTNKLWVR